MKLLLVIFGFILVSLHGLAQITPVLSARVANPTTSFDQNLPIGTELFVISDSTKWITISPVAGSSNLISAEDSFIPILTKPAVTRVGLTAPLGLTVTGSPITSSGSLVLSYTDNAYSIPSNTQQGIWSGKQNALKGTGLIRMSGTSLSYDNASYVTGTPWLSPFTNTGAITATDFCRYSDIRMKKNIRKFNDTDLWKASQIELYKYNYISDSTNATRYGPLAQEVEELFPDLVTKDSKGMRSVSYLDLLIVIVAQQKEAILYLEKRIKHLENEK